jgi:hypothetical protein
MRQQVMGLALLSVISCGGGSAKVDGGAGSGGRAASGGAGGTGGEAACASFTPCGGDLVGTWNITETCVTIRSDLSGVCNGGDAWATGTLTLTGSLTYNTDHTYTSTVGGAEAVHYHYPSACLQTTCDDFGQTLRAGGVTNLTCTTDATAATCDCDGVAPAGSDAGGTYSISGTTTVTTVPNSGSPSNISYCVQGNVLREAGLSPDGGPTTPPASIVFTRQ